MASRHLERWIARLRTAGAVGMAVFFGCLVAKGEATASPAWLVWPAFVVMQVGVWGGLALHLYLRHERLGDER